MKSYQRFWTHVRARWKMPNSAPWFSLYKKQPPVDKHPRNTLK